MNPKIEKYYRNFREYGWDQAVWALRNAKTLARFEELEAEGRVKIVADPECENYWSIYGEPEGYVNGYGRRVSPEEERKEIEEWIERFGCWFVVALYLDPFTGEWEHADSIGMCIYDDPTDPYENCYVPDLQRSAIRELEKAEQRPANALTS